MEEPRPLTLPAILINPKSSTQAQVQAFASQQQEKAKAQRASHAASSSRSGGGAAGVERRKGEGKRSYRRRENAVLVHNPHATAPTPKDYLPPPPLHHPSFPKPTQTPSSLHSSFAPSPSLPTSDPSSSHAGTYSLSLKGVRQLLRKRGRRAEVVVGIIEKELVGWLEGVEEGNIYARRGGVGQPRIIDSSEVQVGSIPIPTSTTSTSSATTSTPYHNQLATPTPYTLPPTQPPPTTPSNSNSRTRQLPHFTTTPSTSPRHLSTLLTSFYFSPRYLNPRTGIPFARPAVVELVRSPGHLIWVLADGFERLVGHLLCRYYELLSFSQTLNPMIQADGTYSPAYRITHILLPQHIHPPKPAALNLLTPDNTDFNSDTATETERVTSSESESGLESTSVSASTSASTSYSNRGGRRISRAEEIVLASDSESEDILFVPRGRLSELSSFTPPGMQRSESVASSDSEWGMGMGVGGGIGTSNGQQGPDSTPSARNNHSSPWSREDEATPMPTMRPSTADFSDSDDGMDYASSDDDDSAAGMMDSLLIGDSSAGGIGQGGVGVGVGSLPSENGFLMTTTAGGGAQPPSRQPEFISQFNLPLDLFPARRAGLDQSKKDGGKKEKVSFFDYLYL